MARPNVIWVFGDQHRMQALSCMGDPNVNTPNIDRLSAEGFTSTGAVAGFPLCCPCRGSLVTGVYPHKCVPGHEYQLPPEQKTIAHAFKAAGYGTAWIGKWHLDGFKERNGRAAFHLIPRERRGGFDTWIGYENNNAPFDCWVHGHDGAEEVAHHKLPGYESDALTDLFIAYIKKQAATGVPFFAALSVQPPHDPYIAPPEDMARHNPAALEMRPNVPGVARIQDVARRELAGYYASIERWDMNVGRVRAALEEAGIGDNTHIIFFSDHGDQHGSQGQFRKMAPWEESIRVPFIMSGGSTYAYKGGRGHVPVNHVDLAPTSLGLCGIEKPDWMAGTDYSGLRLKGKEGAYPDSAYLQSVVPTGHGNSVDLPWRGVVTADGWKYVCFEHTPWLMFNLNDDPYEQVNLAHNSRHAKKRKVLHERLVRWVAETGDSFALPVVE